LRKVTISFDHDPILFSAANPADEVFGRHSRRWRTVRPDRVVCWFGFAFAATGAQWALERAALLTPMMASTSKVVGGVLLIMAGLYQWSPLKDTCLASCRAPLLFIQRYGGFRRNGLGALEIGLRHGAYCVGCCWALMTLLFVGGVMNVLWIAAIAALVLAEKVAAGERLVSRAAGTGLILGGVWLLMR
jgi:predicted metal-binding membrane protein